MNLVTDQKFGDIELYLEFMLAKGSNSGVYLHGLYEVQIFDSYGSTEPMTSSDGGGIYHRWIDNHGVGGSAPSRNASRRPGEWQSYHIWFRAPRFDGVRQEDGKREVHPRGLQRALRAEQCGGRTVPRARPWTSPKRPRIPSCCRAITVRSLSGTSTCARCARLSRGSAAWISQGALRRYWGYDSFRPLQERIVRACSSGTMSRW